MYAESVENPEGFWAEHARKMLKWEVPFNQTMQGSFAVGDIAWFVGGKLNASVCCVDQHLPARANQVALLYEGDEPGDVRRITYQELLGEICRIANVFADHGVSRGQVVTVYMPMVPETCATMLACSRLGAPHSVVFAGFSADALRDRVNDCKSMYIAVSDEGVRGGKKIKLKEITDKAAGECPCLKHVFVFERTGAAVAMVGSRDVKMAEELPKARPYRSAAAMDSEETLFILYTSGSTGKPKGVAHTTAGYLLYAAMTTKHTFGLREGDVYACVADVGWITGHSYIVYGPLINGTTSLMFESVPTYPDHGRYWDLVAVRTSRLPPWRPRRLRRPRRSRASVQPSGGG